MNYHLRRLSVVTATLLISLSCPLQVVGLTWGNNTVLAQAQTTEQRDDEALRLYQLGIQQLNKGQFREALETFEQILITFKAIGHRQGEGTILHNIGFAYANLGQYPQALAYFQQALAIAQEMSDKVTEGKTLNGIGQVYNSLGQYSQALESYQKALAITKKIGDKTTEGMTLTNMGVVYDNLGQYPQALESYQQALAIIQEIGNKVVVYDNLSQYPQALESYQQALAIVQEIGNKVTQGIILNNMGVVYGRLGQDSQALESYQQGLAIAQEIGNKVGEGTTLHNIGEVYRHQGQYPQALKYFQQALAIRTEIGNQAQEGTTLNNMGVVNHNQGQYPQALKYFQQALAIAQEMSDKAAEGMALHNIGAAYDKRGQYPQALKYFQQALAIRTEIGDKAGESATLNNIGGVYNTQGKYAQAETTLFAAIKILESLRARQLRDDQKISFFEQQSGSYSFLQQALVAQNKFDKALLIAERSRGRALVELLDSKLAENPSNLPDIKPPTIQELKQVAFEQNATLVQYSIVDEAFKIKDNREWQQKLYIWIIKPTGKIAFKKVDLKSLNQSLSVLVTNSRDDIGVRGRNIFDVTVINPQGENSTKNLQQLHKLLIAPIADLLPKDPNARVIFIPQKSLFLVPFAALQDEQGKYLIEKHTILTAPSIQVLDLTRKQKRIVETRNCTSCRFANASLQDVLIVGNPTMPKIKIGKLEANLEPLPGAEKEAIQIAKLFNTKALTGSNATKTAVMQKMQKARIIHLATHGLLHDFKGFGVVPGAIALAPSGTPDDVVDGLLTAGEIFDMKLSADLVVLSACDTGRGDITGDGVVGLSRSLISAGVPSVMVSLWAVNDNSTAFLMTEFYRNLQQNPDKAVSLRQAMLTAMKQYPNPKQWAAFTLIGESE
ncbi:tetratricopeptide repeat protein [Coleofasciculus sp. FACHB-64]|uniref:CHAT domain-containing protein n=1 Tax=Cyanophyceae TaxID=3028117 RepID=UPI001682A01B|nr:MULTISPECIES: tetratricopeptide repeat protein [unclassified Coleofasciculus]MBD1841775.1 tetratricopeptide repeat protein [Coleofasciculus sp. FACHB-501]MBD2047678.1 tetratricopeptide repeat protein [Coleofasciculus sp. FACHB-64]